MSFTYGELSIWSGFPRPFNVWLCNCQLKSNFDHLKIWPAQTAITTAVLKVKNESNSDELTFVWSNYEWSVLSETDSNCQLKSNFDHLKIWPAQTAITTAVLKVKNESNSDELTFVWSNYEWSVLSETDSNPHKKMQTRPQNRSIFSCPKVLYVVKWCNMGFNSGTKHPSETNNKILI